MEARKTCRCCGISKDTGEFHRNKNMRDGRLNDCKPCVLRKAKLTYDSDPSKFRRRSQEWYRKNGPIDRGVYLRDWNLRRTFGITHEQYEEILASQGGGCAVCGTEPRGRNLHIDHDHTTGAIRGVLCGNCNRALGYLGDDHSRIIALAEYIHSHASRKEMT